MVKDIIQVGNKLLNEPSEPIDEGEISAGKTQELVDDLLDTVSFHVNSGAGISAVQIGELKRIYVVRRYDLESDSETDNSQRISWEVLINPKIVSSSKELNTEWEGCLSIGKGSDRLFGPVSRPQFVEVEYFDREGNKKKIKGSDFFSSLIQHEADHLEGVLFLKYVKNPANIWREEDLDKYIKSRGTFPRIK